MSRIHPSAQIDPQAELADGVEVGPFVVIEADVIVGKDTKLLTGTLLQRGSRIGKSCQLGPYAIIGGTPMDANYKGEPSFAVIEDNVTLREFVTVHLATGEAQATRVGRGAQIMCYSHITHNVQVGEYATLATNVQLGGHCQVGAYAFLGASSMLHQFCRIGSYAIYAAGSAANQDILPFSMAMGMPAKHFRLNKVGLERRGITGERYKQLEKAIRAFRRKDWHLLESLALESDDVRLMLEYKSNSKRGICGFAA